MKHTHEVVVGIAIFVGLVALYNWAEPWSPGSLSRIQSHIGYTIWLIGAGLGAMVVVAMLLWRGIATIVARLRRDARSNLR